VLRSSQIDQKRAAHRKLTEVSELLDRLCHLFAGRACTADLPLTSAAVTFQGDDGFCFRPLLVCSRITRSTSARASWISTCEEERDGLLQHAARLEQRRACPQHQPQFEERSGGKSVQMFNCRAKAPFSIGERSLDKMQTPERDPWQVAAPFTLRRLSILRFRFGEASSIAFQISLRGHHERTDVVPGHESKCGLQRRRRFLAAGQGGRGLAPPRAPLH
jgi:hypothetical protein